MTYYDYLCRLIEPMRIYRTERGCISGGELYAAGKALDNADDAIGYAARGYRRACAHQRRQLYAGRDQLDARRLRHPGDRGGDGKEGGGEGLVPEHGGCAG